MVIGAFVLTLLLPLMVNAGEWTAMEKEVWAWA